MDTILFELMPAEFNSYIDTAELERRWSWTDALDGFGDPHPDADWSSLSA